MSKKLKVGDRIDGYCFGIFSIDEYSQERIVVKVKKDYVVLQDLDYRGYPIEGSRYKWHGDQEQLKTWAEGWREQVLEQDRGY